LSRSGFRSGKALASVCIHTHTRCAHTHEEKCPHTFERGGQQRQRQRRRNSDATGEVHSTVLLGRAPPYPPRPTTPPHRNDRRPHAKTAAGPNGADQAARQGWGTAWEREGLPDGLTGGGALAGDTQRPSFPHAHTSSLQARATGCERVSWRTTTNALHPRGAAHVNMNEGARLESSSARKGWSSPEGQQV
jgi:hypothetical protein